MVQAILSGGSRSYPFTNTGETVTVTMARGSYRDLVAALAPHLHASVSLLMLKNGNLVDRVNGNNHTLIVPEFVGENRQGERVLKLDDELAPDTVIEFQFSRGWNKVIRPEWREALVDNRRARRRGWWPW